MCRHGGFPEFVCRAAAFQPSVAGVAVASNKDADVAHGPCEAVEAFLFVVKQSVGGDDDLPAAVPDAATDEAVAGEFGRQAAQQDGGVGHGPEGRVLADDPWLFRQGAIGVEDLGAVER